MKDTSYYNIVEYHIRCRKNWWHLLDFPGIAIVQGTSSVLGKYEYKCSGGSWQDVDITNTIPVGGEASVNVLYLTPNDEIKFTITGNQYWTPIQASKDASFTFLAWDMTNNGVSLIWC